MIRKITSKKMENYLLHSDEMGKLAIYLKEADRREYKKIVDFYTQEAVGLDVCIKCQLNDDTEGDCCVCDNGAILRFIERDYEPSVLADATNTEDALELTSIHAGWAIHKAAKRNWLHGLNATTFYRLVSNLDLLEPLRMVEALYSDGDEIDGDEMLSDWENREAL